MSKKVSNCCVDTCTVSTLLGGIRTAHCGMSSVCVAKSGQVSIRRLLLVVW